MLLAVDVGNTQTHIGMFRDGSLVEHWRFATVRESTSDELATVLVGLLELRELLGAIISPGVEISMEALSERAARLPKVELEEPKELIGRSTQASIQSGVIYGFAGQVDGIVARLREELGVEAVTIATGGLATS